jgi:hypothetical protein
VLFGHSDNVGHDGVHGDSAGVHLPPSRASSEMAPHGVAAPPNLSVEASTIVSARLPTSRASPKMAPRGVVPPPTPFIVASTIASACLPLS